MIPKYYIIIAAACIVLLFLADPASATPIPVIIRGSVVEMNESAHTVTLRADCERYSCRYNVTGLFVGRVPNREIFSRVKPGEVVEAVFKDWIFQITDPSSGYIVPSRDTHNIRQWYTIQSLAHGDNGTLVSTELFGDPGYVDTPLDAGYRVDYRLSGSAPHAYDYATFPRDTLANTSVRKDAEFSRSVVLATGKVCRYSDTRDNTTITIQFIGGYDAGGMEGKACPCADYHIRVLSEKDRTPLAMGREEESAAPHKSPSGPLLPVLVAGAMILVAGFRRMQE
ncbi:hypothetical protein [Methanoregula sp.]|uniref:hypothetical protein n=1 Tax=Methanoregula sp. TaxID=2052170 RepID=UPI00356492D8